MASTRPSPTLRHRPRSTVIGVSRIRRRYALTRTHRARDHNIFPFRGLGCANTETTVFFWGFHKKMKPHSLVSACVLLECAAVAQALQGTPDPVTVAFLCVGVTSVIHHSRLDAWWKRDAWRLRDYVAIAVFSVAVTRRFGAHPLWICAGVSACAAALGSCTGAVSPGSVPVVHAAMHAIVGVLVVCLVAESR